MNFTKACALGNDFVITQVSDFPNDEVISKLSNKVANRRYGVGCDQVIFIKKLNEDNFFLRFFNQDGTEAEACGNGTRCVAKLLIKKHNLSKIFLQTLGGNLEAVLEEDDRVTVLMPSPLWDEKFEDNSVGRLSTPNAVAVWIGNPHLICFVDNINLIEKYGVTLEEHPYFTNRTNVGFVEVVKENKIRLKVWERGAGVTPACGSGACAATVASVVRGLIKENTSVEVAQSGGNISIFWDVPNNKLFMTSSADTIFSGNYDFSGLF
jgi:diaminopimelate epimerase